jgi:SPRY domain
VRAFWLLAGDVIGILLNQADHTITYTKNGIDLGVAFTNVRAERLFPAVGLRTPDEEVGLRLSLLFPQWGGTF